MVERITVEEDQGQGGSWWRRSKSGRISFREDHSFED